jgi:predicted O-linked N-acetylglucosamine transferase (SPINDLY family)
MIASAASPNETPARAEVGLPDTGFVFACFNNTHKIGPEMFGIWTRLLQQIEGSVLWLFEDNALAADNLRREAAARGLAPERLIFAQRMAPPDHLARTRLADLFLDTLPYNAHTTASDALWMGLPVVTCPGKNISSARGGELVAGDRIA